MRSVVATLAVAAATILGSCGGQVTTRSAPQLSRFADDVARLLGIGTREADTLITTTAREAGVGEAVVAQRISQDADVLATRQSRFASILDGIETRVSQVDVDEVLAGTLCAEFQRARTTGEAPTVADVFDSLVQSVGEAYANAIFNSGQIHRFVGVVNTLTSGDPQQVSILIAENMYC
jgi:hypothetical protein